MGSVTNDGADEACGSAGSAVLAGPEPIDAAVMADRVRRRSRHGMLWPVLAAIALHGAAFAYVITPGPEPMGSGGQELDAISIEVTLVSSSKVMGSAGRAGSAASQPSRASPGVSDRKVAAEADRIAKAPAPTPPTPAKEQPPEVARDAQARGLAPEVPPAPAVPVDDGAAHAEPPHLPALALMALPTLEPTKLAADLLPPPPPSARLPASTLAPATATAEPRVQSTTPATTPARAAAVAAAAVAPRTARAPSAASAGQIQAFNKGVMRALAVTQPERPARGLRGTVKVAFSIAVNGGLAALRVQHSSGHGLLDEAALTAVKEARFPVPPPGMDERQRDYVVPYIFR